MSDAFLGEIRIFAGTFPPANWAFCDGNMLPAAQNAALYSVIGTAYGTTDQYRNFALPDLRARAPMGAGTVDAVTVCQRGEVIGSEVVALEAENMPLHRHQVGVNTGSGSTVGTPQPGYMIAASAPERLYTENPDTLSSMNDAMVGVVGEGEPHDNMSPFINLNFIIALRADYPPHK